MKLNELMKRMYEYYNRDILPPVHEVPDELEKLDPGVAGTPEIESKEDEELAKELDEELDDDSDEDNYDAEDDVYPDNLKEFQKVKVIRGGKPMKVLPPKKGYKRVGDRYEKMSAQEQKAKSKIAKKGWKKKKPMMAKINKNRAKSMKRRKSI